MEASNVKAMREALAEARRLLYEMQNYDRSPISNQAYAVKRKIDAALAKPPRNCDVGTVEEQTARYDKFCNTNRTVEKCCTDCPALGTADCELLWAQMPYEEGGAE